MSAAKVRVKGDELSVESSDLLKAAQDSKTKEFLKIPPYQIRVSIGIDGFKQRSSKQDAAVEKAAEGEAKKIEDELVKMVKDLVKELEKLQKEDQAGNKKAGEEASKRVKATGDKIEDTLPEFGRRIRKAIEHSVGQKLPSSVKSVGQGRFGEIVLIGQFEGGDDSEFEEAFTTVAKSLGTFDDEAVKAAQGEEKANEKLEEALTDALEDVKRQKDAVAKAKQEADKAAKTAEDAAAKAELVKEAEPRKEAEKKADKAKQAAKEARGKVSELEFEFGKSLPTKARKLRDEFENYGGQIEEFKKGVDAKLKSMETEHRKLLTTASGQEKSKLDKMKVELVDLGKRLGTRLDAIRKLAGQYKDFKSTVVAEWEARLTKDLEAVKKMDKINVQKLVDATKQLEQLAAKM
jgi:hypothetical protein